jgi:hypothetical protein
MSSIFSTRARNFYLRISPAEELTRAEVAAELFGGNADRIRLAVRFDG